MSQPIVLAIDGTISNRQECRTSTGKPFWRFDLVRQETGGRDRPDVERAYPCQFFRSDMPENGTNVDCEATLGSFKSKAGYNNVTLTVRRIVLLDARQTAPPPQPPPVAPPPLAQKPPADQEPDTTVQDASNDVPFLGHLCQQHAQSFKATR